MRALVGSLRRFSFGTGIYCLTLFESQDYLVNGLGYSIPLQHSTFMVSFRDYNYDSYRDIVCDLMTFYSCGPPQRRNTVTKFMMKEY